jgi:hypothetical protein
MQPLTKDISGIRPQHAELSELLRDAAKFVELGNLGSACWRLADAGLMLRQRMLAKGFCEAEGLDQPTNRGAILPPVPHHRETQSTVPIQ